MRYANLSDAARAVVTTGMSLVETSKSDNQIRDEIRQVAHGNPKTLADAARNVRVYAELLGAEDHLTERARRVFDAAAANTPVAGRDPMLAELYRREEALAALSQQAAVAELRRLSSELEAWCRALESEATTPSRPIRKWKLWGTMRRVDASVERLVGPTAAAPPDPLLRSPYAAAIIQKWAYMTSGLDDGLLAVVGVAPATEPDSTSTPDVR